MKIHLLTISLLVTIASVRSYAQAGGNLPDNTGKSTSSSPRATSVATTKRPGPGGRRNELTIGSRPASAASGTSQSAARQGTNTTGQGSRKQAGKTVNQQAAGVPNPMGSSNSGKSQKPVKP